MKNLIIYLIFLSPPLLATAQTDSVKVSFSEERVENFEKTTLIDEYEKAFGNNRIVKSSLRVSFTGLPGTSLSSPSAYPIRNFIKDLNPILQFEQKLGIDKSIIASFSSNRNKDDVIWNTDIGLEGRLYYQMKKRVAGGKQQPNIIGRYISLKVEANPYRYSPVYRILADFSNGGFLFRATSTYSINWGWQLGNNVNYGFAIGVKHGDIAGIDSKGFWVDATVANKTATTWFISSNAQVGLGLFLPLKKRTANNFCDFLQCNYEVKQLFKINLNDILYFDRYTQALNLDIAYERKIGRSPFSINSNLKSGLYVSFGHEQIGYKLDSVYNNSGISTGAKTRSIFSTKLTGYGAYNYEIAEQLRYYIGMKNRIAKGKSANNLNGLYVGILGSYRFQNQGLSTINGNTPSISRQRTEDLSGGISVGYQLQTNRRSFLDMSTNLLRQRLTYPVGYPDYGKRTTTNSIINFSIKMGFAK